MKSEMKKAVPIRGWGEEDAGQETRNTKFREFQSKKTLWRAKSILQSSLLILRKLGTSSPHLNHCKMTKCFLGLPPTDGRNIPIAAAILAEQIEVNQMVLMLQKASFAAQSAVGGIPFLTKLSAFRGH